MPKLVKYWKRVSSLRRKAIKKRMSYKRPTVTQTPRAKMKYSRMEKRVKERVKALRKG